MTTPRVPSAEELWNNSLLAQHRDGPELLRTYARAVLEAAAEQYTERQEQRWLEFFEPAKSDSAKQAFSMMMRGVKLEAAEIRALKEDP